MTKRVGAKQECGASTPIEETLLDLVRWHDSHSRYKALVRCVAVRPSADLHDDRPASIDLLAIAPTHADKSIHWLNAVHDLAQLEETRQARGTGPSLSELITIQWQRERDDLELQNFLLAIYFMRLGTLVDRAYDRHCQKEYGSTVATCA